MARVRIVTFQNSILASLIGLVASIVQLTAAGIVFLSIISVFNGMAILECAAVLLVGLMIEGVGIGLLFLAKYVNRKAEFRKWRDRYTGLERKIATTPEYALEVYLTSQTPDAYAFVTKLNPQVKVLIADYMQQQQKEMEAAITSWDCPVCGHNNHGSAIICAKCNTVK